MSITEVLYVPHIKRNLILVKKLIDKGLILEFNRRNGCEIKHNGVQIAIAHASSNLVNSNETHPSQTKKSKWISIYSQIY